MTDTCKSITFPQLPPSPTVPLCMSVLTFLGIPLGTPRGLLPHSLYLYVCLYSRSLAYPSAHPQVSTLTNCTSMYICTYVLWHTPRHTHRSAPSPTVILCMSVLTFLGIPLGTPTGFHPHQLYLYRLNGCFTAFNYQLQGKHKTMVLSWKSLDWDGCSLKQERIIVGCVPSAAVAVCWGVCLPRGVCRGGGWGSARSTPLLGTEWLTDRCKNITLPELRCGW